MDFESCNSAAQFAIQQSQNSFVIPNATPFIEFGLNMLAKGHVGPTIRIFDVTQPLSFAVFDRVHTYTNYDVIRTPPMMSHRFRKHFLPNSVCQENHTTT